MAVAPEFNAKATSVVTAACTSTIPSITGGVLYGDKGVQYDLWVCNLGNCSAPSTTLTSTICSNILKANTSTSNGTAMLTNANPVVEPPTVTYCFSLIGCRTNYAVEMGEALLSTDYSQATLPTTVIGNGSYSNMLVPGSTNCGVLLSPVGSTTNCGVLAKPTPYFGGCAHIDLDEPTGMVTCANGTNFTYGGNVVPYYNFVVRRTMIFSLAQSAISPVTQVSGGLVFKGGASFLSQ